MEEDKPGVSKDALPPSPPMTDSATSSKSSPPATIPHTSPRDSPAGSPGVHSNHSGSPSATLSPLPPLPAEVFLNVLSYLSQEDVERSLLVSRSWHSFLENEPSLWRSIYVDLTSPLSGRYKRTCERSNLNGKRSNGGIRSVTIVLNAQHLQQQRKFYCDIVPHEVVQQRLLEALEWVTMTNELDHPPGSDGARRGSAHLSLAELVLDLRPSTGASALVLHILAAWSTRPIFSNLRSLVAQLTLAHFAIHEHFFRLYPSLHSITIDAALPGRGIVPLNLVDWNWQPHLERLPDFSLNRLERLTLSGVYVSELEFPLSLPSLRHVHLNSVKWEGRSFFYLLRLARKTLQTITCHDLTFEAAPDELEDWMMFVDAREPELTDDHLFPDDAGLDADNPQAVAEVAPIILPVLHSLHLSGLTPPFFASLDAFEITPESEVLPTPVFVMPNLRRAVMEETTIDPETTFDDSFCPLVTLGRSAPLVELLHLRNVTCVGDVSLHLCIAAMSSRLVDLDISDTYATDHLIVRLPDLTPSLKRLDVRDCPEITCQGVARAVEVIQMRDDEGVSRVKEVHVSEPKYNADVACWRAYRWLDFIGVLCRDMWDFEGYGPELPEDRRQWKLAGKLDVMHEYKAKLAQQEEQKRLLERHEAALRAQAGGWTNIAGGAGSSGSASGGVAQGSLTALAQITAVQQQCPQQQVFPPQNSTSRLPPSLPLSTAPVHRPTPAPSVLRPVPVATAYQQQPATFALPRPPPPHLQQQQYQTQQQYQQQQQHQQRVVPPAPPPMPQPQPQTQSAALDLASLDTLELENLDPALLAEQQLAMQQAQQRHQSAKNAQESAATAAQQQQIHQQTGGDGDARTAQEYAFLGGLRANHALADEAQEGDGAATPMQTTRTATPIAARIEAPDVLMPFGKATDGELRRQQQLRAGVEEEFDELERPEAGELEGEPAGFAGSDDEEEEEEFEALEV